MELEFRWWLVAVLLVAAEQTLHIFEAALEQQVALQVHRDEQDVQVLALDGRTGGRGVRPRYSAPLSDP